MTALGGLVRFPELTTDRLRLRGLRPTDAEAIHSIKSDPLVTAAYGREPYLTLSESEEWIAGRVANFLDGVSIMWGITLRDQDRVIGTCCFWNFDPDTQVTEVGYELARANWGQGIASEAVGATLPLGFRELGLHRIAGCPASSNRGSIRVLQKLGFLEEGKLRQRLFFQGRYLDLLYFGLLRDQWSMRSGPAGQGEGRP